MAHHSLAAILSLTLGAITIGGCSYDHVYYVPVETRLIGGDPTFVEAPEVLDGEHLMAIQMVLFSYGEPFEVRGRQVLIERRLREDPDLLTNYTEKAERLSEGLRALLRDTRYNTIGWPVPSAGAQ
jgi:hypothetical protein